MTRQLAIRMADELVAAVDALVAAGKVDSRSEAMRLALVAYLDNVRRAEIGARIAEGYRRVPPDADLDALAAWSARQPVL